MTDGRGNLYQAFGKLVQAHRRRVRGMTQAELGRRIGLSRTSVTNIEHGRHHASLDQLFNIANALDVPPEALLPRSGAEAARSRMADVLPQDLDKEIIEWADRLDYR